MENPTFVTLNFFNVSCEFDFVQGRYSSLQAAYYTDRPCLVSLHES